MSGSSELSELIRVAKLEALRQALAEGPPEPLFDREHEKAKARVRERALRLLDQRGRSRFELTRRLEDLDFEASLITEVVADLERHGLIDDELFAREWVRQRHAMRGKSRRALAQELAEKGISPAVREVALSQIDDRDEEVVATRLAEKKARTIKQPPADRQEYDKHLRRIVGILARRGYAQHLCLSISRIALDERIAELEDQN